MDICPKCRLPLRNTFEYIAHRLLEISCDLEAAGEYSEAQRIRRENPADYTMRDGAIVRRHPPMDA
jgi:hypothetical protein